MDYFGSQLFNGLMLGFVYGLVAVGFSLVYGVARLMNFAHGEFFMAGAFGSLFAAKLNWSGLGLGPVGALIVGLTFAALISALIGAAVSVLAERLAYRRVRQISRGATFLVALALSILLQHVGFRLFSASPRGFPSICAQAESSQEPRLLGMRLAPPHAGCEGGIEDVGVMLSPSGNNVVTLSILLMAIFGALWFVFRTDTGLEIRAISMDEKSARSLGIRPSPAVIATFAVGGALAGVAGFVWALRYGSVQPLMGFVPGIKAFVAAVVGGFGSVTGALLGGLLLGLVETLSFAYLPGEVSGYRDAVTLLLLVSFLLLRPHGILGVHLGESA